MRCKHCGSDDVVKRGAHYTPHGIFQKYQCKECGKYIIGEKYNQELRAGTYIYRRGYVR